MSTVQLIAVGFAKTLLSNIVEGVQLYVYGGVPPMAGAGEPKT
jgi:hypothetical protein